MDYHTYHIHSDEHCFEIIATCAENAIRRVAEWLVEPCECLPFLNHYSAFTVEYNPDTRLACKVSFTWGALDYVATPICGNVWILNDSVSLL